MEFQLRDKSILGFIKRNLHLGFEDQQKWNDLRVSLVYQTFNLEEAQAGSMNWIHVF